MTKVVTVDTAEAFTHATPLGDILVISATGTVDTSGWTDIRFSPHFYATPPSDGIWDFDLIGDPPSGIVAEVVLPVAAMGVFPKQEWVRGVRIRAETNQIESGLASKPSKTIPFHAVIKRVQPLTRTNVIVERELVTYDDSIQPTGGTRGRGWPPRISFEMKKLRHTLVLTVEGPDQEEIHRCLNESAIVALLAALVAAAGTGGAALPAAISAFLSALTNCLGYKTARVDDRSHWIKWWT
ncbi:MAG: hypothetical protein ACREVE_05775 [Gammaproteobacteria bacterium]